MNPSDRVTSTVTPAARILARCVAAGTMTQSEIDAVPREPEIFSSSLLDVERLNRIRQELDQGNLDVELLKLERECADVTHSYYLSQKFDSLQQFSSHLQEVLREKTVLLERLTKPLCQKNLPVQADDHRYVVELMRMVVEFIENLDMKVETLQIIPSAEHYRTNLDHDRTRLLTLVTEVENLYKQVLEQRESSQSSITNMSSSQ